MKRGKDVSMWPGAILGLLLVVAISPASARSLLTGAATTHKIVVDDPTPTTDAWGKLACWITVDLLPGCPVEVKVKTPKWVAPIAPCPPPPKHIEPAPAPPTTTGSVRAR